MMQVSEVWRPRLCWKAHWRVSGHLEPSLMLRVLKKCNILFLKREGRLLPDLDKVGILVIMWRKWTLPQSPHGMDQCRKTAVKRDLNWSLRLEALVIYHSGLCTRGYNVSRIYCNKSTWYIVLPVSGGKFWAVFDRSGSLARAIYVEEPEEVAE